MRLLITTQAIDKDDPILGFFHGWVTEFAKHFAHIDVICLREGVHSLPNNVSVHSLGKENSENRLKYILRFYRYFWNAFMNEHVDYVFFHMGAIYNVLAIPFFYFRKIRKTKFFWWKTHGKVRKLLERLALFGVDVVVTAGSKSFDIATLKRRVVGHAIDTEVFQSTEAHTGNTQGSLIMVGRIVPIKRIEVALDTLALLIEKGSTCSYTLTIVGSANDLRYEASLLKKCNLKSLETVNFVGSKKQSELPHFYHHSAILLHPAFEAGFDKVVLEAMAIGVIPLTSIPSFEQILSPHGLYIRANDVEGYVNAVERITTHMSNEKREQLQKTLRDIVCQDHSLVTLPLRIFGV